MVLQINNSAIKRAEDRLHDDSLIKKDLKAIKHDLDIESIVGYNIKSNQFEAIPDQNEVFGDTLSQVANSKATWEYTLLTAIETAELEDFKYLMFNRIAESSKLLLSENEYEQIQGLHDGKLAMCDFTINQLAILNQDLHFTGSPSNFQAYFEHQTMFSDELRQRFFEDLFEYTKGDMASFLDTARNLLNRCCITEAFILKDPIYAETFKKYLPVPESESEIYKLLCFIKADNLAFLDSEKITQIYLKKYLPQMDTMNYNHLSDYLGFLDNDLGFKFGLKIPLDQDFKVFYDIFKASESFSHKDLHIDFVIDAIFPSFLDSRLDENGTRTFMDIQNAVAANLKLSMEAQEPVIPFQERDSKVIKTNELHKYTISNKVFHQLKAVSDMYLQKMKMKEQILDSKNPAMDDYTIFHTLKMLRKLPIAKDDGDTHYYKIEFNPNFENIEW